MILQVNLILIRFIRKEKHLEYLMRHIKKFIIEHYQKKKDGPNLECIQLKVL